MTFSEPVRSSELPMRRAARNEVVAIRPSWLAIVVTASQRIAGVAPAVMPEDVYDVLNSFAESLPNAISHIEGLLLRAMLWDVAIRFGEMVHERIHGGRPMSCGFVPSAYLARVFQRELEPRRSFIDWAEHYQRELLRAHPPTPAAKAARLIREHYERRWTLEKLAIRVHATPSQLRRGFRAEFGVSIREYQRSFRLIDAVKQVPHGKIESIALQVGYRSKKDFYRAFRQVLGLTPAAFRRLPDEQAAEVVATVAHERSPRRQKGRPS